MNDYKRAGRPLVKGGILAVQDLNMEGQLIKTYTKTGTVPRGFFQIRNGIKVEITKEEYETLKESK
jgi:hypothetical protein